MAKIKFNPLLGEITGAFGDMVFVKHKPGHMIVRNRPVRTAPKRAGEAANQERFKEAVQYAKKVWTDQRELRDKYNAAARLQGRQGFHLAKADFRLPPRVQEIVLDSYRGVPGDIIQIVAVDDFEVTSVDLVIRHLDGTIVEQGPAILEKETWIYRARAHVSPGQTVTISVTATDHPRHTHHKHVDHVCGPRL